MKVEILSRDLVKPSSPTPAHLRDYKLCLLDQFIPPCQGGIIYFYSGAGDEYYSRSLKNSLSETLTDFYPIAGRFKDSATIDCNDEGACFVEAKINSKLSDFLNNLNRSSDLHKILGKLVPTLDSATMNLASNCMLIAQLTVFECRGFAISFCLEHRFCDLSSVVVFLRSWSARARGASSSSGEIVLPDFVGSSFLPPKNLPPLPPIDNPIENRTTVRLVFEPSKISDLKTRFSERTTAIEIENQNKNASRIEVVLALLLKCAISAAQSITSPSPPTKSVIFQSINLRRRTEPPLPENSMGNLFWMLPVMIDEGDVSFQEVASKMRRETTSFWKETARRIKGDEEGNSVVFESMKERGEIMKKTRDLDLYLVSSWCKFPLYDMDFGWGKPVWVTSGYASSRNLIVLEDTKCGSGMQAWVTLDPNVMAIFERYQDLLSFASFNPLNIS